MLLLLIVGLAVASLRGHLMLLLVLLLMLIVAHLRRLLLLLVAGAWDVWVGAGLPTDAGWRGWVAAVRLLLRCVLLMGRSVGSRVVCAGGGGCWETH